MPGLHFRLLCIAGLLQRHRLGAQTCARSNARGQRSMARPGPGHLQQSSDERRRRGDRHRDALSRRGRGDRSGHPAHHAFARRQPPRAADHAGHRPEPGADGGEVRTGTGCQCVGNLDAGARQQLYRRSCRRRTERRQALHDKDLCEGLRRLLGPGRQECRRSQEPGWARCDTGNSRGLARAPPAARARRRS